MDAGVFLISAPWGKYVEEATPLSMLRFATG